MMAFTRSQCDYLIEKFPKKAIAKVVAFRERNLQVDFCARAEEEAKNATWIYSLGTIERNAAAMLDPRRM